MDNTLDIPPLNLSRSEMEARFDRLQRKIGPLWKTISAFNDEEQTIVVIPSISVDFDLQGSEMQAYEERFLFLLLLLRQPRARMIYVTCQQIRASVIDYYLGLLPGVIISHARERLFLVSPEDADSIPLSVKVLQRPRLIERIRKLIPDPHRAHLVPFNTTDYERQLALRLGIPMYGADPKHDYFGTKSGGRKIFSECGVEHPIGFEDLKSFEEVLGAVQELRSKRPDATSAMVKLNAAVSGEGNAVVDLTGLGSRASRGEIEERVRGLTLEHPPMGVDRYFERLARTGGIVEERIVSDELRSPSVQLRVTPQGEVERLSTHDQLLGGPSGQSYLGCKFPADDAYATTILKEASRIGDRLAREGVLGRFAIDFLTARIDSGWKTFAIEVNLRKGGTTHPFLTLQFLTNGSYDPETNVFSTPGGASKCFVASDHIESPRFRVFTPDDLFDIAVRRGFHFDQALQKGVVFHMMAAVGDRGRFGLTAVGDSHEEAFALFERTREVVSTEAEEARKPPELPDF